MSRIGLAFKLFFRILSDTELAARARLLVDGQPQPPNVTPATIRISPAVVPPPPSAPQPAGIRSEAITLLAVLQREARLVDFLKENITPYDDAQVGAAVRDVHRGAAAVIERLFSPRPVMPEAEGAAVTVPAGADAGRIRLTGNVSGQPPYTGVVGHAGWEATKVELPDWTGSTAAARVIAPGEVEIGK